MPPPGVVLHAPKAAFRVVFTPGRSSPVPESFRAGAIQGCGAVSLVLGTREKEGDMYICIYFNTAFFFFFSFFLVFFFFLLSPA